MNNKQYNSTAVNRYFAWLEETVSPDTALYRAAHEYMESERGSFLSKTDAKGPFLSIVTRTQGKRPEMLSEMLLCLTGQTNTDFELLVMGHNLSEEQQTVVSGIIDALPAWMREKTRLIPVEGGTRTTPLNKGFAAAQGSYIAVLDDDDLVFDNWVEAFYKLSQKRYGRILHTYSVVQDWEVVGGDLPNTPRAANAPEDTFCRDFKLMDELNLNYCPLCTLAFPAYVFQTLGIHFDESLTTTEDWDYLMRCAFLVGVANSSKITFLYRRWLNAESSATVHVKKEWIDNYKKIVENFIQTPILLPPGTLKGVIGTSVLDQEGEDDEGGDKSLFETDMQIYYDLGEGFSSDRMLTFAPQLADDHFEYCFSAGPNDAIVENVQRIRFDPQFLSFLTLSDLTVRVVDRYDQYTDYTLSDATDNGYRFGDQLVFLREDPQIILPLREPAAVKQVLVSCELTKNVDDAQINAIIKREALDYRRSIPCRAWRKLKSMVKKGLRILRFMRRK